MSDAQRSHTVAATRLVSAPAHEVYAAWTQSGHVRQWWGPHGFHCPVAKMDVRVGGSSLVGMQAAAEHGGVTLHSSWTYTRVEAPYLLEFESRFTDAAGEAITPAQAGIPGEGVPMVVPHVVAFSPLDDGATVVLVLETGYTTSEARDMSRHGLEQCLDKLASHLEPGGRG